jgi:hypothetical protein
LPGGADASLDFWLSLDNESITVPETLDAVRARSGVASLKQAYEITDRSLSLSAPLKAIGESS